MPSATFFAFGTLLAFLVSVPALAEPDRFSAFYMPNSSWNPQWTRSLVQNIRLNKRRFERARDIDQYCPGYYKASEPQQVNCWVRLTTGIIAYESGTQEQVRGDGGRSYGLMQIQAPNCRRFERFRGPELLVASNNLRCGTRMMGDLIARDGMIARDVQVAGRYGTKRTVRYGLGRGGWSVMMRSQLVGRWQVGHLNEIAQGVRTYLRHETGTMACSMPRFPWSEGV